LEEASCGVLVVVLVVLVGPIIGLLSNYYYTTHNKINQRVCRSLPIYIKKYLNAKEKFMETQIFHHAKTYSSKNPLKETKVLQDITTF
jgi:hypothetical protein